MAKMILGGLSFIALLLAIVPTARAEDTALVGLHELRWERGKLCMSEHAHVGSSSGLRTRKLALKEAKRDWAGFTAWEYGDAWGNFRIAGGKTGRCVKSRDGWACDVGARACRRGTRAEARRGRGVRSARTKTWRKQR